MPSPTPPRRGSPVFRTALRVAAIAGLATIMLFLLDWLRMEVDGEGPGMAALFLVFAVYALLLAVPFVPGVEIGVAILMMRGADLAPMVWMATVCGLSLAFVVGCKMPLVWLERMFRDLGQRRVADLIARQATLSNVERLSNLCARLPGWMRPVFREYRYVSFAILLNIPGNSVIGGGGGLALLAGLSRLFAGPAMMLTLALAVAPVPFAVWIFGPQLLPWTN